MMVIILWEIPACYPIIYMLTCAYHDGLSITHNDHTRDRSLTRTHMHLGEVLGGRDLGVVPWGHGVGVHEEVHEDVHEEVLWGAVL